MLENIEVLIHSSIKINKGKVIYIDPYKIDKEYNDADFIFITHSHYDHFSEKDIIKVIKNNTTVIIPEELMKKVLKLGVSQENIIPVEPNECEIFEDIKFETIPAYNINKPFHKKENGWVGYIIELKGIRYYIAGDTDITEENQKVQCDVAFVPVAGTYTMDYKEAAKLVNTIKPKVAIPIHYGDIVGIVGDAKKFIKLLDDDIRGEILIK
jgi:L-ascorbate metabolism protein UlaG (beta-lactamase superfamily)